MQKKTRRHSRPARRTSTSELVGAELTLDITGVAHRGVFVGRVDGRVVFTPDTLPGERVAVTVVEDHGSYLRAVTDRVVEASPQRQAHVWPEADIDRPPAERVGGADFGHIRIDEQRRLKATVLRDALERVGHLESDQFSVPDQVEAVGEGVVRDQGLGWRTRVGLHVAPDGRTGPLAARSHDVIDVSALPLAAAELGELGEHLRHHEGASRVDLVLPSVGEPHVLIDGAPDAVITQRALGIDFAVSASGFWQVHRDAADTLSRAVLECVDAVDFAPSAANLDLYGGAGLFAAILARATGARVTSVEADATASMRAADNLTPWRSASAVGVPTLDFLRSEAAGETDYRRATVVLDPPRAGAGVAVIDAIVAMRPANIVYVACDPVAFARDAGNLVHNGYAMTQLRAFDLYPNSHHLETVALFVRE